MFGWKSKPDPELCRMSDQQLKRLPLAELQRIRNKRWANDMETLVRRADAELARRDPRQNWKCLRCGEVHFHEKEMRVSGGFVDGLLNWQRNKYHVIVCNYCGKSEMYNVLMSGSEKALDFLG